MFCAYLSNGFDFLPILELREEFDQATFFYTSLQFQTTSYLCAKYEQSTPASSKYTLYSTLSTTDAVEPEINALWMSMY